MLTLQLHRAPSVYKLPRDGRLASIVNMLQVRLVKLRYGTVPPFVCCAVLDP